VLPAIDSGVERVLEDCDHKQGAIVRKFYDDYADEVRAHLNYEETQIFPYVESLAEGKVSRVQMAENMANHTDICDKVDDVKSIIIKYLPESCPTWKRCDLLFDLYRMSDDLAKHTLIETKILAPLVYAEERRQGL
jgi:regulator of cell morphogenesis and NO signaling